MMTWRNSKEPLSCKKFSAEQAFSEEGGKTSKLNWIATATREKN
jgi:hypothetical protein